MLRTHCTLTCTNSHYICWIYAGAGYCSGWWILVLRCGGLVYCLVGAWLEVSIVWAVWSLFCMVVVPYFMMLSFFVLSGGWRIFGRGLRVLICICVVASTSWFRMVVCCLLSRRLKHLCAVCCLMTSLCGWRMFRRTAWLSMLWCRCFCIGVHVIGFVLFRTVSLLALYTLYLG